MFSIATNRFSIQRDSGGLFGVTKVRLLLPAILMVLGDQLQHFMCARIATNTCSHFSFHAEQSLRQPCHDSGSMMQLITSQASQWLLRYMPLSITEHLSSVTRLGLREAPRQLPWLTKPWHDLRTEVPIPCCSQTM